MPFIHLAQATEVPDAEVVEQAARVIDTFSNLGPLMAVLFIIALMIALLGGAVFVLVWSNRKTSGVAVDTLAQSNAEKIAEIQEVRRQRNEEITLERNRHQQNHDQFMLMFAAITNKQVEGDAQVSGVVTSSEQSVKQAITSSEGRVIAKVDASKEDVLAVLRLLGKVNTDVFQPVASEPPDLEAMQIILEDTIAAIEAAKKRMQNTPKRATSEVPAAVVIADISPVAVSTIVSAVTGTAPDAGAATEGGESEDKVA